MPSSVPKPCQKPALGIVRRQDGPLPFAIARYQPSPRLSPLVERYWRASWDLGEQRYDQEVLATAAVGIVVDSGSGGRSGIWGPVRGVFVRSLTGVGRVFGIRFRPGAFRSLYDRSISQLTDKALPLETVFGRAGATYEEKQLSAADDDELLVNVERFLASLEVREVPAIVRAQEALTLLEHSEIRSAAALAEAMNMPLRTLQRIFKDCLGVSPKWSIKRLRFQQALERLHLGEAIDFAALAHSLGYFDQAHFNREFRAIMGCSPGQYKSP